MFLIFYGYINPGQNKFGSYNRDIRPFSKRKNPGVNSNSFDAGEFSTPS